MANSKSQQYEVIKNGPLCLDKYCADIVPFGQGFNKKNSPLLGGAISNVFSKENSNISQYVSNGNHEAWLGTDNYIYIDGKKTQRFIEPAENYKFVVDPIEGIDDSYLDYLDSNTYLRVINNNKTLEYKLNGSLHTIDYNMSHTYKIIEKEDHTKFLVDIVSVINTSTSTIDINIKIYNSSGQVEYAYNKLFTTAGELSYAIPVKYRNLIIKFGRFNDNTNTYVLVLYLTDDEGNLYCKKQDTLFEYSCGYIFLRNGQWKYITPKDDVVLGKRTVAVLLYQDFTGYIEAVGLREFIFNASGTLYYYYHFCMHIYSDIIKVKDDIEYLGFSDNDEMAEIDSVPGSFSINACVYTSPLIENLPGFRVIFKNPNNSGHSFIFCKDIIWGSIYSYGYTDDYNLSALVGNLVTEDTVIPKPAFNKRLIVGEWYNSAGLSNPHYYYEVLVDKNNKIQSFSFTFGSIDTSEDYTCNNLGTLLVPIGSVSNERPFHYISETPYFQNGKTLVYFDAYDKIWKKIHPEYGIDLAIVDDYLLINTISRYNAININDLTNQIWANDWNNRFVRCSGIYSGDVQISGSYFRSSIYGFLRYDNFLASKKEIKLSSAYNYAIMSSDIPSSQLPEDTVYLYTTLVNDLSKVTPDETYYYNLNHMGSGCDIYDLEVYKNGTYNNSISTQVALNYNEGLRINSEYLNNLDLVGTTYLVDSLYYTPAITMKLKETYSNRNLVSFDNLTYALQYYGDVRKEKLIYSLSTQYYGIEDIFIIQGQGYFTQNNKIYSFKVSADYSIIESVNFITNIQGLTFKANTTREAYFWSKNDSSLYVFTADNILRKLYTATDITDIYDAIYYPSLDATVFDTNIGLLCLNDNFGMFCINNTNNGHLYLNPNGYITLFSDKLYYYNLWFLDDTWTKKDIILSTKFYGVGSNMISITDTWYFRLFADKSLYEQMDISRSGKLKLSIDALTDQGMSTETKEISIKESDWDALTDTLYIRYQPKLQRGVGISLNVESPFAIGYLGLGNIMETTQMSRPSMQA
jgi:hypothetical protein